MAIEEQGDALGRETRRASTKGFRLEQSWDAVGQLVTQDAGRGASALDELHAAMAAPSPDSGAHRRYRWDKAGAPTGIDDALSGETRYRYDANGQVAEASFGDGFRERFDYDAAKNVVGVKVEGPQVGPGIGGLLAWRSTPGGVVQLAQGPNGESIALTHDVCGRVVERRVERKGFRPKTWKYGWDAHDRLVRCDNPEGETWFYRYDPFGRRLTKVRKLADKELAWTAGKFPHLLPAAAREATKIWTWPEPPRGSGAPGDTRPPVVGTHFTWDGDVVAEEAPLRLDGAVDWAYATCWHFEPGGFRPLAKQAANGTLLHIANDHLGTPREMFDEGGHLRWAASFTTWGVIRGIQLPREETYSTAAAIYPRRSARGDFGSKTEGHPANECTLRFQGQQADCETGLYYNRYRHYDPIAQQYVSTDPIGLVGGDRPQGYVANPTAWVDPSGLSSCFLSEDCKSMVQQRW